MKYISITGPTASGKSALGRLLAHKIDGEIINCDSVQIYRGFDIGSAKETMEEREGIPHHLIDILDAHEDFDAAMFADIAKQKILEINARQKVALVVGGTGLYLRALWGEKFHDLPSSQELRDEIEKLDNATIRERLSLVDPERAAFLHINDRIRLVRSLEIVMLTGKPLTSQTQSASFESPPQFVLHIQPDRQTIIQRIEQRVDLMLEKGLIEEVKNLRRLGIDVQTKPMQSIGYFEVNQYLDQVLTYDEMRERIIISTRQYAKRQVTWFNKIKKDMQVEKPLLSEEQVTAILKSTFYSLPDK